MKKINFLLMLCLLWASQILAQSPLTVDYIMRDNWIGHFPSSQFWSEDGKTVYFNWNPDKNRGDSLYKVAFNANNPSKVSPEERRNLTPRNINYNQDGSLGLYVKNGDLYLLNTKSGSSRQLTNILQNISNPQFFARDQKVAFVMEQNLYALDLNTGILEQKTNIRKGAERKDGAEAGADNEKWLKQDQLAYIEILAKRKSDRDAREEQRKMDQLQRLPAVYIGNKNVGNLSISTDGRYVVYQLIKTVENKNAQVPNYVTESGYTENIPTRVKVGSPQASYESWILDTQTDKTYQIKASELPGIKDLPDYVKDYPEKTWEEKERPVIFYAPKWSDDGSQVVMEARSQDNKDRWFVLLNPGDGSYKSLERQRDEAWIGGPGIGNFGSGNSWGWLPGQARIWFQSEESGYSHLYTLHVGTGEKKALTSGKFEVYNPQISKNKKNWYFSSNEVHFGERHFYTMPLEGGKRTQITSLEGNNNAVLSPDEKHLAILYSDSNTPWELYIQENKAGARPRKITSSQSDEFKEYNWRKPELVQFKAEDGAEVPARLYKPAADKAHGGAVIFVHGAGYLQNVHKWWSSYFREYMFHNLLTDLGYTVLDIDFRASSGYGRDWRTGIYRHMGGKDLSDQVDGAKYLVAKHGVDAGRIGIYGGSYGGFITLMALFNNPETFKAGAALRSVTDWAHYNHPYTSNILNEPHLDSLAYARSSPIYFAEGLQGHLLIAHGMIDTNVHFQDVVRLAQRLIELRKDNWEMAVYPLEDHGFVEESSWADEYRRILKLFEQQLR